MPPGSAAGHCYGFSCCKVDTVVILLTCRTSRSERPAKALDVSDRKAEGFREDGRALFDGSQRQTAHESPSDPERVYLVDRFGYARSVYPAAVEQACNCGRYALKSEPEGINCLVDGKPYYTGKEN